METFTSDYERTCSSCREVYRFEITVKIPPLLKGTVSKVFYRPSLRGPFVCWKCEAKQYEPAELDDYEYALRNMVG
jgi:hypothetical protein